MSEQNELESPVLGVLALAVERVAPPAGLRERILSAAARPAEVVPITRKRREPALPRVPLAAVAAMVVDGSLTGYGLMAVTVEDAPSGTTSPTQQPQIYGNLA